MVFIIILAIIFFVLAICVVMVACLKMAGKEDEWLMREMEEKSIENADVFVHDGEPIGEVISVEEKDGGVEAVIKIKEDENGLDNN